MARDLALLSLSGPAVRVYQWTEPWVTLGAFQTADDALLPNCPIPWVQRPTGGKAVLHGHDLTIALAAPLENLGVRSPRQLRTIYRAMVAPLLTTFSVVGIDACLGEDSTHQPEANRSSDCFAGAASNDIVLRASGHKICGCALRAFETSALMQCSIPVALPLIDPSRVFPDPAVHAHLFLDIRAFSRALTLAVRNL